MRNAIAAAALGLTLTGFAGPAVTEGAEGPAAPRVFEVQMVDRGSNQWRFEPADLVVKKGDTVRFVMVDVVPHNVEFKKTPGDVDLGALKMGPFLLQSGATYDVPIDDRFAPGVYRFVCTPHEMMGMVGSIEVSPGP